MSCIVYIINSLEGGGAALPLPSIIGILKSEGFTVEVLALTRRDGRALPALQEAGVRVHVREGGEDDHRAALLWIARQVKQLCPDALWTSLTRATLLGQLIGIRRRLPVVSWQHAAFLKPANQRLLRLMQRGSTLWVADSRNVAELTRQRLNVDPGRLLVWPMFRADPDAPRASPWRPGEVIRIGSLGRLHPVKGFDRLVEAVAQLKDVPSFAVTIAGEGGQRATLESRAAELGLPVAFPGFLADAPAFLAAQHLYVQPSKSEGLCVAAHQAMAAGLPVVASAVGELPNSIVDGVSGRLVAPGDVDGLAMAIGDLLRAPQELAALGRAGRERVLDRFGPDRFDVAGREVCARLRSILDSRAAKR